MARACIAIVACCLFTACEKDPPHCDSVDVPDELVVDVGVRTELVYETAPSVPSTHKELQVRCPKAEMGALSLSHDGFGCRTDLSDASRSTGWLVQPAMEYVLDVNASIPGTYKVVAEVRDNTEEARFGDPICTVATTIRVLDSRDAAVADD